jgi:hypothetical protein
MESQVNNLLQLYFCLAIQEVQTYVIEELEKLQVRGDFTDNRFIGFDYKNQQWIEYQQ